MLKKILTLLFLSIVFGVRAQERGLLLAHYFSANSYLASTQNWSVAQDNRGVVYFANSSGVLEYDGVNWNYIELPNRAAARSLAASNSGVVYVGAYGDFGALYPNNKGAMSFVSFLPLVDSTYRVFNEVWDTRVVNDTVYFLTDKYLYRYHNNKISYYSSGNDVFYLAHTINDKYVIHVLYKGLFWLKNQSLKLIPGSSAIASLKIHSIIPFRGKQIICSRDKGIYVSDFINGFSKIHSISDVSESAKKINEYFVRNLFYHGISINDSLLALTSILGDVLVVNRNWEVVDVIDQASIGVQSNTNYLYFQPNGLLWMALNNGIACVELLSPYRYWNLALGIYGVLSDVAQKGNFFYVSTSSGLFYHQKTKDETFKPDHFKRIEGNIEQVWEFLYFQDPYDSSTVSPHWYGCNGKTHLLVAAQNGVFEVKGSRVEKISKVELPYCLRQSKLDKSCLYIGHENGVNCLRFINGKWGRDSSLYVSKRRVLSIGEDSLGNLWFSEFYNGVGQITNPLAGGNRLPMVSIYDSTHGLPNVSSVRIFDIYKTILFIASDKFYSYNSSSNRFKEFEINKLQPRDTLRPLDTLLWKRLSNQALTEEYVTYLTSTESWISTDKGVFKVRASDGYKYFNLFPPIIRKVSNKDSVIYWGTNFSKNLADTIGNLVFYSPTTSSDVDLEISLPYKRNSLVFSYAWPYFETDGPIEFSYQLVGNDEDWSEWTTEIRKEYTNLREGRYTFRLKARSVFGIETSVAEFLFEVKAPWYRTIYVYILYIIAAALIVYLAVLIWHYELIRERDKLERLVRERTQEILLQKEELRVQAEHLKDAYEWITEKNSVLEKQKSEIELQKQKSEEINATKNKFFRIIAHDLRNPISTLVGSTAFLLTDMQSLSQDKIKQFMAELNKLALTTYGLLENLLDWSSNEMGDIQNKPSWINILLLVNQNLELINNQLIQKNITLGINIPHSLVVFADENMMNTVLRNLLTNAVKFTQSGGKIQVKVDVQDSVCALSIIDNGVGIPPQNIEKLFRIDKSVVTPGTQNEKGSGLGLLLCKEFVEKMGGAISVSSKQNEGTIFTITFKQDMFRL